MASKQPAKRLLSEAVRKSNLQLLRDTIAAGVGVNQRDSEGVTLLMEAAANRFADGVRELLSAGADPNLKDIEGWSVAEYAVDTEAREVLQALSEELPRGRSTRICSLKLELLESQSSRRDADPLFDAARAGDVERVRELLGKGLEVDVRDDHGMTALMHAAAANRKAAVQDLLEASASTELRCLNDWWPIEHAAHSCSGAAYDAIYRMSSERARESTKAFVDKHKQSGSWRHDRPDLDEQLRQQEAPKALLAQLEKSASPFSGQRTLDLLGRHELPLSVINLDGQGPLFWAAKSNNLDLAFDCLAAGCDPNSTDYFGSSPLSYACRSKSSFQVARVLWSRSSPETKALVCDRVEELGWDFG